MRGIVKFVMEFTFKAATGPPLFTYVNEKEIDGGSLLGDD